MSIKIMAALWGADLPHSELLILMALADHAHHDGTNAYPGIKTLEWKTNYSPDTVRRCLKSLVKKKILTAQERPGKPTVYTIHLDKISIKPYPSQNATPSNDAPTPPVSASDPSGSVLDEPSIEPSYNQKEKESEIPSPPEAGDTVLENQPKDSEAPIAPYNWSIPGTPAPVVGEDPPRHPMPELNDELTPGSYVAAKGVLTGLSDEPAEVLIRRLRDSDELPPTPLIEEEVERLHAKEH